MTRPAFTFIERLGVIAVFGILVALLPPTVQGAPYASGVTITGTNVSFILNDDADSLMYSVNGGAATPLGTGKGTHTFTLGTPTDTFSIVAEKTENGFTIPSGSNVVAKNANGLTYDTQLAFGTLISNLSNSLTKFNSPRGLAVSLDPNAPNFGTAYISNSSAGSTGGRTLTGRGLYALKADQTDAIGNGNAAAQSTLFGTTSTNTPYKVTVAKTGEVYVSGYGDALSGVWRMPADLSTNSQIFTGTTGNGPLGTATCDGSTTACLPVAQNHGSVLGFVVTGSTDTGDLKLYTIDEDMTSAQLTRVNGTDPKGTDNNKLWQYNIGAVTQTYGAMPTLKSAPFVSGAVVAPLDVDLGADGKFYMTQNRAQPTNSTGLFVTDPAGNVIFDSRVGTATVKNLSTPAGDYNHDGTMNAPDYVMWRKQNGLSGAELDADGTGNGSVDGSDYTVWRSGVAALQETGFGDIVNDLYSNIFGVAVSPDQKWLATLHNNGTVMVTPLVNGIPDIANRLAFTSGALTTSARDIAFDAAGNLHVVSQGTGQYSVFAPGGHTIATTTWLGASYAFNIDNFPGSGSLGSGAVPEPGTLVLAAIGLVAAARYRERTAQSGLKRMRSGPVFGAIKAERREKVS